MERYKNNAYENYFNKIKELPKVIKQLGGLAAIMMIIFLSFFVLNIILGEETNWLLK